MMRSEVRFATLLVMALVGLVSDAASSHDNQQLVSDKRQLVSDKRQLVSDKQQLVSDKQQVQSEKRQKASAVVDSVGTADPPVSSTVVERPRKRNEQLLTHLGLSRMRSPLNNNNHHRKRLADASQTDSHVYVIKLPPNPYYYAHEDAQSRHAPDKTTTNHLDVGFKSNGKPSKIYHYNLPMVRKMVLKTRPQFESQLFRLQSTWDKTASLHHNHHPGGKTSYYKPRRPTTLHKYFPGNGKPQSMYVIQRSRLQAPATYHRLLLP